MSFHGEPKEILQKVNKTTAVFLKQEKKQVQ